MIRGQAEADAPSGLPGTPQHQALLRAILSHYQHDPRMRAITVFGSLGRGTWDAWSDIDLNIILTDGVSLDVRHELHSLCDGLAASGESAALVIPDGDDAGDIVFESLLQLSVRYHPLDTTSPNIVESVRVLAGELDRAAIVTAGLANRQPPQETLQQLLDACVRYAAVTDVALHRRRIWITAELLHRMRSLIMALFARSRGAERGWQAFEAQADAGLQARLGAALPAYSSASLQRALLKTIDILQNDLPELTDGQAMLTHGHLVVLDRVRDSQTRQRADSGGIADAT
jgi:hypothetical protein